jgi:hypothetical protein
VDRKKSDLFLKWPYSMRGRVTDYSTVYGPKHWKDRELFLKWGNMVDGADFREKMRSHS